MGEFLGATFAVALLFATAACLVAVPAYLIDERQQERSCAEKYQVFACERGDWKPIVKDRTHD